MLFGFASNFHRHAQQKLIHQTGLLRFSAQRAGFVVSGAMAALITTCIVISSLQCYPGQFSPARWQATIRPSHSRSSGASVRQRLRCVRAAGMEAAAGRQVDRAGHFAHQHTAVLVAAVWIRLRDGIHQKGGIGVHGAAVELFLGGNLIHMAQERCKRGPQ